MLIHLLSMNTSANFSHMYLQTEDAGEKKDTRVEEETSCKDAGQEEDAGEETSRKEQAPVCYTVYC